LKKIDSKTRSKEKTLANEDSSNERQASPRGFWVNDFLSLKLEGSATNIYVKGERFDQCKFLLLDIPVNEITALKDLESIDEAAERLDKSMEMEKKSKKVQIAPEVEFWGHCSNLQVWAEHDYDTRLIHSNLAFPLLRKLTEVGDLFAKRVFKDEIAKRFESGCFTVILNLILGGFLDFLDDGERKVLFEDPKSKFFENIKKAREFAKYRRRNAQFSTRH